MTAHPDIIVIPSSSPEQNWARSVSPCTPERLFDLPPRRSSPISLPSPSELFEILSTKPRAKSPKLQSPLREDVGKANLPITKTKIRSTTAKEKESLPCQKDSISSAPKPKTTRTRKSAKPETTKNKTITGRVAKSTVSKAKIVDTNGDTSIHGSARTPLEEAQTRKNVNLDDLNLEEAIKRRLDWTPPKSSPLFPPDNNDNPTKTDSGFGGLLHDYRYNREKDAADNLASVGEGANPTKRRRIELVERVLQEPNPSKKRERDPLAAVDAAKEPENHKVKPAAKQKKARTITALVTSRYETGETDAAHATRQKFQPSDEQSNTELGDDGTRKKKKTKKATVKSKEPEYIILSPEAVTKTLDNQDLLFGTCSQLETDDHPAFLRETQRAIAASENDPDFNNLLSQASTSVSSKSIASRFTGSKSLWSAATRDSEGFVVQPEILDMTNSPKIRSSHRPVAIEDVGSSQKVSTGSLPKSSERIVPRELGSQKKTSDNSSKIILEKPSSRDHAANPAKQASTQAPEMPRYNGFTDDELRKQIASYGFKSVRGRSKMIALLEKCWQSKNTATTSTAEKESTKTLSTITEETAKKITEKQPATKKPKGTSKPKPSNAAGSQKAKKQNSVLEPSKTRREFFSETAQLPPSTISVEEIADSEEEPEPISTRIQTQSKTATASKTGLNFGTRPTSRSKANSIYLPPTENASSESLELYGQITKAIRSQPRREQPGSTQGPSLTWHEKILLYDPVLVEDLATWLNTEGLGLIGDHREVGAGFVRKWCESKGVCCTYRTK
ncbi:Structure-specific endonuclease subunit slx4 [Talaromyces islandicus]|uniref:Structure-specific endonuclease subunit SLX4 n=1 Tax=Talaromyces islandicus TaxID=28573 RepID=A0A0U1M5D7_TALIS|nr:Structure-specific endonuclease subunit slx4 [Talaromyces islandicus]